MYNISERKQKGVIALPTINPKETLKLILDLVSIPSPSGNTNDVITFVENYLANLQIKSYRNRKGGLIATIEGSDSSKHRMLTAHVDTLGAMVKEVKSNPEENKDSDNHVSKRGGSQS